MMNGSILAMLRSRSLVEFVIRADELWRNITHVTKINVEELIPPYYSSLKVSLIICLFSFTLFF
jgi:hypothetical protein